MFHTSNPIIKHKAGLFNLVSELQNFSSASGFLDSIGVLFLASSQ
jgi:hypothetical protein